MQCEYKILFLSQTTGTKKKNSEKKRIKNKKLHAKDKKKCTNKDAVNEIPLL